MDENGFIIRKRLPSPHPRTIMIARYFIGTFILIFSLFSMAVPAPGGALRLDSPVALGRATATGGLFVVLLEGGKDQPGGLQIIDAADSRQPRLRGFLALPGAKQLAVAADGKLALAVVPQSELPYGKEVAFQVIALDLTNPDVPKEAWRETVTTTRVTLAPGATAFAYSRVVDRDKGIRETIVVPTADRQSRTALRDLWFYSDTATFSPSGKLITFKTGGSLSLWDLRAPKPQAFEQASTSFERYQYGCITAVLDNGHVVMQDARAPRLGIYRATAALPRISTVPLDQEPDCPRLDANGPDKAMILSGLKGQLWRIDLSKPQQPGIEKKLQLPAQTQALAASGKLLLALDTIDKHQVRFFSLDKAHKETPEKHEADKKAGAPLKAADKQDNDVCKTIAAYANANRLSDLVSDIGLDIPFGGRRIDLVFTTEGTAHVPAYYAFDTANDFPLDRDDLPAPPAGAEDLWGGDNLALLTYDDRHFILYHRGLKHPVSGRNIADGALCRFKVETVETIGPKALDREFCSRLQGKNPPPTLSFKGKARISRQEVSERWSESEVERTRMLDIANDGNPLNVAELSLSSGAGAGCDATFYDLLDTAGTSFDDGPKRDLLLKLQNISPGDRFPVRCQNKPRFFTHQGKIHFETRPTTWPPIDDWNQYHEVRMIDAGQVREVCDFRLKTRVSVDRRPMEKPAGRENN